MDDGCTILPYYLMVFPGCKFNLDGLSAGNLFLIAVIFFSAH